MCALSKLTSSYRSGSVTVRVRMRLYPRPRAASGSAITSLLPGAALEGGSVAASVRVLMGVRACVRLIWCVSAGVRACGHAYRALPVTYIATARMSQNGAVIQTRLRC